ncbi:DUF4097 family beta strand repeat protein [Dactylosporangium roseum]|uniref:DUF4097 family beta strand repeat protein n=1 Tax=Dactylosporangium roseum TaxID=47989 RepID=A0ABY5Z8A3_9ACTN|nr:DUF4097 domain-containing protein [Dactylosporangium roseum]UWZ37786.1 DUF4097 family beta strand repeat protein [Dactylosporangium roseum]
MPTTRTLAAQSPGPIELHASLGAFSLSVIAEQRTHAELTISTTDDSGSSADAVNAATLDASGDRLTVRFPQNAGTTVIQSGRGFRSVSVNSVGGVFIAGDNFGVIQAGGGVFVNGRPVSGGTFVSMSPVHVVARVPSGSSIGVNTISGDVGVVGDLDRADVNSTSGSVELGAVRDVDVRTVSGSISVERVSGRARLNSTSGSIDVSGPSSARCDARTVSGSVRAAGGIDLDASSVSGRVRNR